MRNILQSEVMLTNIDRHNIQPTMVHIHKKYDRS